MLYIWYSGRTHRAHGTQARARAAIGLATLRRDGFASLRCGSRGGEVMTEPVRVDGSRLLVNAAVTFGRLDVRLIRDEAVAAGYAFEDCDGAQRDDRTDFEITWGQGQRDPAALSGQVVRPHLRADNAASLYAYRFATDGDDR